MTYRGDEDAQRARIEELEQRLQAADAEIAVLRGQTSGAAPGTQITRSRLSGGPSTYVREIVLDHAISELGYEAIAEVLRTRLGLEAKQVGRSLTVPGAFALSRDPSGTRIRLTADWRAMRAGVVATSVMAGFFTGLASLGVTLDAISHGLVGHGAMPAVVSLAALGVTGAVSLGAGWGTRRRTSRISHEKLADYEGTFAAIVALAETHAVHAVPKTRVADEASDASEDAEPLDEPVAGQRAREA